MPFTYHHLYQAITTGNIPKLREYWSEQESCVNQFNVTEFHPFYNMHPLLVAKKANKPEVIQLGLEMAGKDTSEEVKQCLFEYAISIGHTQIIKILLTFAVDLENAHPSVLHACFHSQNWKIMDHFLDLELIGDINFIDNRKNTIFSLLANALQWDLLTRVLLRANANINVANQGQEILFLAARSGSGNVISAILRDSNIDINAKDASGNTAFAIALESNNIPALRVFIHHHKIDLSDYDTDQLFERLKRMNVIPTVPREDQVPRIVSLFFNKPKQAVPVVNPASDEAIQENDDGFVIL